MSLFKLPDDPNWKDISGYEGLYRVSRYGVVRRIGQRIKTRNGSYQSYPERDLTPYQGQVYLSKDGQVVTFRVCDLVAAAFMSEYVSGQKVYHIRGKDDALDNLSLTPPAPPDEGSWKDIRGYEGLYQISTTGQIRSLDRSVEYVRSGCGVVAQLSGKLLTPSEDGGYLKVILSKDGVSQTPLVHRLVAEAFIPNPLNKPQVNHKDGNKLNNCVDNLEWVTASENMNHAKSAGLWDPEKCGNIAMIHQGIKVRCITDGRTFNSISGAAKFYSMDFESVRESIRCRRPRKGFQFEYVDELD